MNTDASSNELSFNIKEPPNHKTIAIVIVPNNSLIG